MIPLIILFTSLVLVFGSATYAHSKETELQNLMFRQYELFNSKEDASVFKDAKLKLVNYRLNVKLLFFISLIVLTILLTIFQFNFLVGDI
ncbi:hypothetical protein KAM398_27480 [Acinetobacter sp. KAM398]|uniref:hypothetical protein n=1 Tax=unclassified Acinetobacter TaxID=196816 RepID=UPI001F38E2CC|nr:MULTISPECIES: hypothetical protein [unclassified Acinetobacter]GJC32739.1 hypothetical protein KAM392_27180 [Acinetobacter sp. KAM392]GJC35564.1 hypothetical protein KAM393_27330 [Acinetobacter sp. KAM393]GJC38388.1 hypothetical protein KAM394_27280 [Acinetobacter sp. KAM394]GJC41219.1 hypothetical protein KAM395_27400 [Acinetobacter sp. KAM395]GJC44015.1 hypothetical protein KAM396_27120 [Acinetobacter sp. KAM396]